MNQLLTDLGFSSALRSRKMREYARYFEVFCRERKNRGLGGGEGGIRTPETLSSLHAFQACALNRARPPLRARTAIMHHARPRGQFACPPGGVTDSDMLRRKDESVRGSGSAVRAFSRTRPIGGVWRRNRRTDAA